MGEAIRKLIFRIVLFPTALFFCVPGLRAFATLNYVRTHYSLGIGYQTLSYSEQRQFQQYQNIDGISQSAISIQGTYRYLLYPGVLELGAHGEIATLPLHTGLGYPSSHLLRLEGFGRWDQMIALRKYDVFMDTGAYYGNLIVPGNSFGYGNVFGPFVSPGVRFIIREAKGQYRSLDVYFKFAWLADGNGDWTPSNREISGGLEYRIPIRMQRQMLMFSYEPSFFLKADYRDLAVVFPAVRRVNVHAGTLLLSTGLEW